MIKNIVFDLGGVIIDFNPNKTFPKYFSPQDTKEVMHALFDTGLWSENDRGVLSDRQVIDEACKLLPERLHAQLERVVLNWWDEMPPLPPMCEFIRELKAKGFRIYLLSNVSKHLYEKRDTIPALQYFDGVIVSADHKCLKPEPEIYHILFDTFSLLPQECFFVDDMQKNIDGAAAVGMAGHCYAHGDVEILRRAMIDAAILS